MNTVIRNIRVTLITLCGLLCCTFSFAQLEQPNRFELERKYNDEDFTIISLKQDGLTLIREKNKYKSGNRTWEIILLDTLLQEKGTIEFEIDAQNSLIGYEHSPGEVHFLFRRNEAKGYMDLLSLDLKSKSVDRHEIKPELTFQLTHFCKTTENFIFGGVVSSEPTILLYNPTSDNLKVLPGFFQKQSELVDVQVNQNQTFNTLLIDRSNRDHQKVIFRTYDPLGKLLLEDITSIDSNIELHSGLCSALEKEDLIVLGSWGKLNSKQASGFYAIPINPFSEQTIKRAYFGQLNHYLDYLKPKRAAVIKEKTLNALEAGRTPEFTNYILPYKIVEKENGFLLLAESYTPSSNSNQYQATNYYPNNYSPYGYGNIYPSNRVYDPRFPTYNDNVLSTQEIKSIQTVVVSFDKAGNVLWDYSVKLDDMKMSVMNQTADFILDRDSIQFLYKKESEIRLKSIAMDNGEFIEGIYKIRLTNPNDEIRMERSQDGLVKHWFGKSFYVWGYQSIRNRMKDEDRIKEIFYINKVVVN